MKDEKREVGVLHLGSPKSGRKAFDFLESFRVSNFLEILRPESPITGRKRASRGDLMNKAGDSQTWRGRDFEVVPLYSEAGVATQVLVKGESGDILLDAGDGVLRDLMDIDYDFNRLKGILVSHGHFDHVGGIYTLLGFLRMIGRKEALPIVVPAPGSEVEGMIKIISTYSPGGLPFNAELRRLKDGDQIEIASTKVRAFKVIHRGSTTQGITDPIPAFGYTLQDGERIVYTGDTGYMKALEREVRGADCAILEATHSVDSPEAPEVHLVEKDAIRLGRMAKDYILIHRTPKGWE